MKKSIIPLILTSGFSTAAVSVSGGFALDLNGTSELVKPDIGDIYILVATKSNDSFENLLTGDSLTVGSTVGGGDDVIIATGSLQDTGNGNREAQATFNGLNISTGAEPNSALSAGDHYAIFWFDGVTSTGPLAEGAVYGVARNSDWIIPVDGTLLANRTNITTPQLASFTVQAVPEPSSVALLGLGALALVARRRRN